jgi:hypothetical protein
MTARNDDRNLAVIELFANQSKWQLDPTSHRYPPYFWMTVAVLGSTLPGYRYHCSSHRRIARY